MLLAQLLLKLNRWIARARHLLGAELWEIRQVYIRNILLDRAVVVEAADAAG
jgi:hypothetical protein